MTPKREEYLSRKDGLNHLRVFVKSMTPSDETYLKL